MKKTITILSLCLTSMSFAQKGSWYLGGEAGFNMKNTKDYVELTKIETKGKSMNWVFAPEVGTFLGDTWQLGLALGINGGNFKANDTIDNSTSRFSLSPTLYCRKFFKLTDNFSLFAGLYGNFTSGDVKTTVLGTTTKAKVIGFGARLGVGVAYAITDRFTLVGQYGLMGFSSEKQTEENKDSRNVTEFDFGVNTVGGGTLSQGNGSGSVFNIGLYYTIFK